MSSLGRENGAVAVFGAAGHTGRFVVDEIERRGLRPIRIGRDAQRLAATSDAPHREPARLARLDDDDSLDAALIGAAAIINCAGPFLDTAIPVIDAALRAGIPYLDITAEQAAVQLVRQTRDDAGQRAGAPILPAAAFFGGLADLLATAACGDSDHVDQISIAVGLDSWRPTIGTRMTGRRNTAPRLVQRHGVMQPVETQPPTGQWDFPPPLGPRDVLMLPFSEIITLSSHLNADTIESWINLEPIRDIRDPATAPPQPCDDLGRSSQRFVIDVVVRDGERRRRVTATGQDIYQVSAPIVVEAAQRLLDGEAVGIAGVHSIGAIFDVRNFLRALDPDALRVCCADISQSPLKRESIHAH